MKSIFYPCKQVGDYWVAIDEKAEIKGNNCLIYNSITKEVALYGGAKDYRSPVIAFSDKAKAKELGLPTFEVKDKAIELALKEYPSVDNYIIKDYKPTKQAYQLIEKQGFIKGYKAAKGYTEAEMRRAFQEGRSSIRFENDGSHWEDETLEDFFISSLRNPQIEIWMEEECKLCGGAPVEAGCAYAGCGSMGTEFKNLTNPSLSLITDKGEFVTLYI